LEFDLKHSLADTGLITCEERDALKILEQERGKWEAEDMQERERERAQDRLMAQVKGSA